MKGSVFPTRRRFSSLAARHGLIPVVKEILGDFETPVSAYQKLRGGDKHSFLLESVEGGETWGRFSILGAAPYGRFRAWGDRVLWEIDGREREQREADPLRALARWLRRHRAAQLPGLPRFFGGAVGSISYDAIHYFEDVGRRRPAEDNQPDIDLMLVRELIVFDNLSHTLKLVVCASPGRNPAAAYDKAVERLAELEAMLRGPLPDSVASQYSSVPKLRSGTSKRRFEQGVRAVQEYIRSGDCFQVVLSHELSCRLRCDPFDVYRALRNINPSPYMFHLDWGDSELLGASPEVLVRVDDDRVFVRPIAGTRRRGKDEAEDQARIADLLADEKERAEHVMLVDLGRNDLGRVCRYGSVRTDRMMEIERYSHVIHLVSRVSGTLREDADCFDALRACFPAGTVSGAPKVRAMEIIDELEQRRRGVYAGAVGYFSYGGAMDTCIAIRTMSCRAGVARLGVGAGIVLDSVPSREWEETQEKAGALRAAIEMAEGGLS